MSENLKADYVNFKAEIQKNAKPKDKLEGAIEVSFKKQHKSLYTLTLSLSKLRATAKNDNEFIYLQEIVSDLLNITKLIVLGWEMPSLLLLRRAIENFYNHVYYVDHRVEYLHLMNGKNEYTPIDRLKTYFDTHPIFFNTEDLLIKDYNQKLFLEYQELCKVVHTKGGDYMNLSLNLKEIRTEFSIKHFLDRLISVELFVSYLIYKFHKTIKLTSTEKTVLTSLVPADRRALLNE